MLVFLNQTLQMTWEHCVIFFNSESYGRPSPILFIISMTTSRNVAPFHIHVRHASLQLVMY